jgi:ATP-binding cassette, subfamily G (WHITE), eye pigment precursor transporter
MAATASHEADPHVPEQQVHQHPGAISSVSSIGNKFSLPVSWSDLCYRAGDREILRGLSGTALPSRTLAIMGSSGAGKTTFLNAICDRLASGGHLKLTGTRQLGDVEFHRDFRKVMGFVTQDDVISALDTPASALRFSIRIRTGADVDKAQQRVDEELQELNLDHCRDTVVGIPGLIAGLSGGERKRCNIGIELITDPKVLLLDEPTSGLDSVTSVKIVALLNELARKGRTIIFTIHQPTAEVLTFFDDLMLMAQGKTVFHGPMAAAVEYFSSVGYTCPVTYTPTDYFMTLLQDEEIAPILIERWEEHIKANKNDKNTTPINLAVGDDRDASLTLAFLKKYVAKKGSTLQIQAQELSYRAFSQVMRNKMYLFMTIVQALFFGIIAGLIFIKLGTDVQSMQDRIGLLFMVVANRAFSSAMGMINTFPRDKAVFIREQQAAAYSPLLYYVSKYVSELPIQLFGSLLEAIIVYFMAQFHQSAGSFFYYFAVATMVSQVSGGLGFAISASVDSFVVAAGLAPLAIVPLMMAAGLLASTDRLRPYWYWLEKPSFLRQGLVLLLKNEMQYIDHIDCDIAKLGATFCAAQPKTGDEYIASLGFNDEQDSVWAMWVSLTIMFFLFRALAVFSLNRVAKSKF